MSRESVAHQICDKVQRQEHIHSRMLGSSDREAFMSGWHAWDETFELMFSPDRPVVLTRFRP